VASKWLPSSNETVWGEMLSKLGKRTVDSIKEKPDREVWLWDTEIKGFGLRVRPSGRKTYLVEYRPGDGGRTARKRRYTIGTHGSPWTADLARAEAQRILGLAKAGKDPAAERVTARHREAETVSDLATVFVDKYARQKQRSWRETQRVFLHDINPAIGSKAVEEVTRQDIVRLVVFDQ
jgi:hypothetical protein